MVLRMLRTGLRGANRLEEGWRKAGRSKRERERDQGMMMSKSLESNVASAAGKSNWRDSQLGVGALEASWQA